ncbi:MAG: tetratricopeptide repeat protein [Patescibacteria group bacterium]
MLTIISLILTVFCLIIILAILFKKFPVLAILDVNNLPGDKEIKFKDKIIKQRVERDLSRWGGAVAKVFLFLHKRTANFLNSAKNQLKKIKLNYKINTHIPWSEKLKKTKELFFEAENYLKKENFNEAEEKLVEIISLDDKNLKAFLKLADLYDHQKKWAEASQTYDYALKLARKHKDDESIMGDSNLSEIYWSLSWVFKELGDLEGAKKNIQEALDLEPNNPRYLDLILNLSIMKKDKESALYYLEKLAEVNPENNKLADLSEEISALDLEN